MSVGRLKLFGPRLGGGQLDLAALPDPHLVRGLGPYPGARPPCPSVVRKVVIRQRLGPVLDDLVVAHVHPLLRLRWSRLGLRPAAAASRAGVCALSLPK